MAKKLQSFLTLEGELPEDGLAAYGDDGEDLTLARKIVSWEVDDRCKVVGPGAGEHHCRHDKIL